MSGQKTGETLHAEVEVDPFQFTGSTIYSDRLEARGSAESPFAELELDQMRVDVSARRFFDHVWQIDQVDVQRLRWNLDGPRIDLPESLRPGQGPPKVEHPGSGLLPDRVEVGAATIHATDFQWNGGGLTGTVLEIAQRDGGWNISGHSGSVKHGTLPPLDIESLKLRLREPTLFLESAEFRQAGNGAVSASGEVRFGDHVDVQAKLKDISITPFLSDDWRVRLTGALAGDVRIQSPLPLRGTPQFSGSLRLNDGHLEALPVLDQIAIFTGSAQFRHLALSKTAGDFTYDGTRLSVTNFEMESARLIRVEGSFTVENDRIDGNFQVGVTPPSLQWLPGAQERVFTTARAGYLWAPMRLSRAAREAFEDLSPKLIAAAKGRGDRQGDGTDSRGYGRGGRWRGEAVARCGQGGAGCDG